VLEANVMQIGLVDRMLMAEYELQLLDKYAGWTQEDRRQRGRELVTTESDTNERILKQEELRALGMALGRIEKRAVPPP